MQLLSSMSLPTHTYTPPHPPHPQTLTPSPHPNPHLFKAQRAGTPVGPLHRLAILPADLLGIMGVAQEDLHGCGVCVGEGEAELRVRRRLIPKSPPGSHKGRKRPLLEQLERLGWTAWNLR